MEKRLNGLGVYILAGGTGERLWPLSTPDIPKQFLSLISERTLLEESIGRFELLEAEFTKIIGCAAHVPLITRHGKTGCGKQLDAILEPEPRGTAMSVALAVVDATAEGGDRLLLIAPSDHDIRDNAVFARQVADAQAGALAGNLVLFGIPPMRADTGFGYVETAPKLSERSAVAGRWKSNEFLPVRRFVEKPDAEEARHLVSNPRVFWNSGLFLFRASVGERLFAQHAPQILSAARKSWRRAKRKREMCVPDPTLFRQAPVASFDRAIVEKADNVNLVPAAFDWFDLGTWQSIHDSSQKDEARSFVGERCLAEACTNVHARSDGPEVILRGASDIAVIAANDRVLVSRLDPSAYRDGPRVSRRDAHEWMVQKAFPFWADNCVDWRYGGFHEQLTFRGKPNPVAKRLRTMVRQTYVFAKAAQNGWHPDAVRIALHGALFLSQHAKLSTGSYAAKFDADSTIIERSILLYDHALLLLASAALWDVEPLEAKMLGNSALSIIQNELKLETGKGYRECTDSGSRPALAGSHMHLLDACLAWSERTGCGKASEIAEQIFDLLQSRIFDADEWIIKEDFSAKNSADAVWSPGHHYEWISLIVRHEKTGIGPLRPLADKVWATARTAGTSPRTGLARWEMQGNAPTKTRGSRIWMQSEALRAAVAMGRIETPDASVLINQARDKLFKAHIAPASEGVWFDQLNEDGSPASSVVPASVFYHIVRAIEADSRFGDPVESAIAAKRPV